MRVILWLCQEIEERRDHLLSPLRQRNKNVLPLKVLKALILASFPFSHWYKVKLTICVLLRYPHMLCVLLMCFPLVKPVSQPDILYKLKSKLTLSVYSMDYDEYSSRGLGFIDFTGGYPCLLQTGWMWGLKEPSWKTGATISAVYKLIDVLWVNERLIRETLACGQFYFCCYNECRQ